MFRNKLQALLLPSIVVFTQFFVSEVLSSHLREDLNLHKTTQVLYAQISTANPRFREHLELLEDLPKTQREFILEKVLSSIGCLFGAYLLLRQQPREPLLLYYVTALLVHSCTWFGFYSDPRWDRLLVSNAIASLAGLLVLLPYHAFLPRELVVGQVAEHRALLEESQVPTSPNGPAQHLFAPSPSVQQTRVIALIRAGIMGACAGVVAGYELHTLFTFIFFDIPTLVPLLAHAAIGATVVGAVFMVLNARAHQERSSYAASVMNVAAAKWVGGYLLTKSTGVLGDWYPVEVAPSLGKRTTMFYVLFLLGVSLPVVVLVFQYGYCCTSLACDRICCGCCPRRCRASQGGVSRNLRLAGSPLGKPAIGKSAAQPIQTPKPRGVDGNATSSGKCKGDGSSTTDQTTFVGWHVLREHPEVTLPDLLAQEYWDEDFRDEEKSPQALESQSDPAQCMQHTNFSGTQRERGASKKQYVNTVFPRSIGVVNSLVALQHQSPHHTMDRQTNEDAKLKKQDSENSNRKVDDTIPTRDSEHCDATRGKFSSTNPELEDEEVKQDCQINSIAQNNQVMESQNCESISMASEEIELQIEFASKKNESTKEKVTTSSFTEYRPKPVATSSSSPTSIDLACQRFLSRLELFPNALELTEECSTFSNNQQHSTPTEKRVKQLPQGNGTFLHHSQKLDSSIHKSHQSQKLDSSIHKSHQSQKLDSSIHKSHQIQKLDSSVNESHTLRIGEDSHFERIHHSSSGESIEADQESRAEHSSRENIMDNPKSQTEYSSSDNSKVNLEYQSKSSSNENINVDLKCQSLHFRRGDIVVDLERLRQRSTRDDSEVSLDLETVHGNMKTSQAARHDDIVVDLNKLYPNGIPDSEENYSPADKYDTQRIGQEIHSSKPYGAEERLVPFLQCSDDSEDDSDDEGISTSSKF